MSRQPDLEALRKQAKEVGQPTPLEYCVSLIVWIVLLGVLGNWLDWF